MPGNGACFVAESLIGAAVGLIFWPKNDKIPWFYRLLDHFADPGKMIPHTRLLKGLWTPFERRFFVPAPTVLFASKTALDIQLGIQLDIQNSEKNGSTFTP